VMVVLVMSVFSGEVGFGSSDGDGGIGDDGISGEVGCGSGDGGVGDDGIYW